MAGARTVRSCVVSVSAEFLVYRPVFGDALLNNTSLTDDCNQSPSTQQGVSCGARLGSGTAAGRTLCQ